MNATKTSKQTNPLSYAFGMFGTSIPINMFRTFALFYYVEHLAILSTRQFATILSVYTIVDVVDNLWYGWASDRTRSRFGRRRPWLLLGTPALLLSFIGFFNVQYIPWLNAGNAFWHALALYTLTGTLDSLINVNYGALFPEIFKTEALRSKTNGMRQIFQFVAMIVGMVLVPIVTETIGFGMTSLVLAGLALFAIYFMTFSVKEPMESQELERPKFFATMLDVAKNRKFWIYGLVNASFFASLAILQQTVSLFTVHVLQASGWVTSVLLAAVIFCAILGIPVWMRILKRKDLMFVWRLCMMIMTVGLVPLFLANNLIASVIPMVIFGLGYGGASLTMDMVGARILDEDFEQNGLRREGTFGSFLGILNRMSGLFVAFGLVLAHQFFGYVSGDQPGYNPSDAARFLISIYPVVIMIFCCTMSWMLRFTAKEDVLVEGLADVE